MLAPGTRLGPYQIEHLIGEGGMGQVFRARDTRLDRTVAVKMLPAALAADSVRRERFEREARSISRLEHPNICPLYDVGEHEGHLYLVMQYLDGETLAERLRSGPLSIKQALDYGFQIAQALAAAHRADIVHRDLKPANVMITRSGVRLLDFGLAREVPAGSASKTDIARTDLRSGLTTQGTILGTLSYMAPEQIDGRDVDTRADVFSFGAVMFEMVTALKAFDGESPARVMSAILRDEPARVSSIVPVTPAALEALIHACLAKDPNERWQNISDVARQLAHLRDMMSGNSGQLSGTTSRPREFTRSPPRTRWLVPAAAAVLTLTAVAAWLVRGALEPPAPAAPRLHALILPPSGMYLTNTLALSPDGDRLAFVAADATGKRQLWMRPLSSAVAQAVAGTDDASDPFWSADGQQLAFFAQGKLKRVALPGGAVADIADVGNAAGGTWNAAGVIVFARLDGPLMRVNAAGGRPEPLTTFDAALGETHHLYPTFLPDGERFVYYINSKERGLYAGSLAGEKKRLFDPDPALPAGAAATPGVYASGRLLYVRDRVLMARPFDLDALTAGADAVTIAETVDYDPPGQAAFTIAGNMLVFRAQQHQPLAELVWVDRRGTAIGAVNTAPGTFRSMALSSDGRTLAIDRRDPQGLPSVWLVDVEQATTRRLTAAYWAADPLWSPDGRTLAYSVAVDSPPNLAIRRLDGDSAQERRLTRNPLEQHYATSFTPDGQQVVFHAISATTGTDLYAVSVVGDSAAPQRLLQTRANEHSARVSPDGRWITFVSDESGRPEVYVSRFPELQGKIAVSSGGGARPLWRRDGRELFYVGSGGRLMAVAGAEDNGVFRAASSVELFRAAIYADAYAPDPTGQRFLVARPVAAADTVPLEMVMNPFQ